MGRRGVTDSLMEQVRSALAARREGATWAADCPVCHHGSLVVQPPDRDERPTFWCRRECSWPRLRAALVDAGVPRVALRGEGPSMVESGDRIEPLPDGARLDKWTYQLLQSGFSEFLDYLRDHVGVDGHQARSLRLGARTHEGRDPRITVPVFSKSGDLVAVRLWNPLLPKSTGRQKTWIAGHGGSHLIGADRVEGYNPTEPVILAEGEPDYLAAVAAGLQAVAVTAGAMSVPADLSSLQGRRVVVCFDADEQGRAGAVKNAAALMTVSAQVTIADIRDHLSEPGGDLRDLLTSVATGDEVRTWVERVAAGPAFDPGAARVSQIADETFERLRGQDLGRRQFAAWSATERAESALHARKVDGAEFVLDQPPTPEALWGAGEQVLWAADEALLIAGSDGVGKTTLAQQVALGRLGVGEEAVLGFEVKPSEGVLVYLALDRPAQIARSLGRMVTEDDRGLLKERLAVWRGPLPINPEESAFALADWLRNTYGSDVTSVVVDSYKDVLPGISEDRGGAALNSAMQEVLARGVQWLGLHHNRKLSDEDRRKKREFTLADIYGSRWLTAGTGSVLFLVGDAGDPVIEAHHTKQPSARVPAMLVAHDRASGRSSRAVTVDTVYSVLEQRGVAGATVPEISLALHKASTDTVNKRTRKELRRLLEDGLVAEQPGGRGGRDGSRPGRWFTTEVFQN